MSSSTAAPKVVANASSTASWPAVASTIGTGSVAPEGLVGERPLTPDDGSLAGDNCRLTNPAVPASVSGLVTAVAVGTAAGPALAGPRGRAPAGHTPGEELRGGRAAGASGDDRRMAGRRRVR